jgi:hypothetical protein
VADRVEGVPTEGALNKLSPAVFVLALICFFLPFFTFSCGGQKVASFTGIQLVTGTKIEQPQVFGPSKAERVGPEPLAILTFLCVVAGLGLSFLKGKNCALAPAIAALAGTFAILGLYSKLDGEVMSKGEGVIQISYGAGFYLILTLLVAALAINAFVLMHARGIPLPQFKGGGGYRFCAQCGSRNANADLFCKECGTPVSINEICK